MTLDQRSRSPHPAAPPTTELSLTGSLRPSRSFQPTSPSPKQISSFPRSTQDCVASFAPSSSVCLMMSSARRGGSSSHQSTQRGPKLPTPSQWLRPTQRAASAPPPCPTQPQSRPHQHQPRVEAPSEVQPHHQNQLPRPRNRSTLSAMAIFPFLVAQ